MVDKRPIWVNCLPLLQFEGLDEDARLLIVLIVVELPLGAPRIRSFSLRLQSASFHIGSLHLVSCQQGVFRMLSASFLPFLLIFLVSFLVLVLSVLLSLFSFDSPFVVPLNFLFDHELVLDQVALHLLLAFALPFVLGPDLPEEVA